MTKSRLPRISLVLLALVALAAPSRAHDAPAPSAPATGSIAVRGAVARPQVLTREALVALGADTVGWHYRGADHRVIGVRLDKVLAACGWERGPMDPGTPARLKRAGLRKAILATAPDGFASLFSAGELDPVVGPTRAYVVWSMDGAPLAAEFGGAAAGGRHRHRAQPLDP